MKKRRVLHQACAFSVAVMLVGVNAVPVVAADNAPAAYTNADETWKGKAWAIITVDSEKGSFEEGTINWTPCQGHSKFFRSIG